MGASVMDLASTGMLLVAVCVAAAGLIYAVWANRRRRELERRLRSSDTKFAQMAALASDWFWEQGPDFRYRFISHSEGRHRDLDVTKFIGLTRRETAPDGATEDAWRAHQADLDAHRPFDDFRIRRKDNDGRLHVYSASGIPIFDGSGRFAGYRGIGRDITDQVEARDLIERERDFLQVILDTIPARVTVKDRQGRYVLVSRSFLDFFEIQASNVLGQTTLTVAERGGGRYINVETARSILTEDQEILRTGVPMLGVERYRTLNDGSVRLEFVSKLPFDTKGAAGTLILAIVSDITHLRHTEKRLRILSRAIDQSPAAVMIAEPDGRLEYVNAAFTRYSGYSASEVVGKNPRFLKSGYTSSDEYLRLWQNITSGKTWTGEFLNKAKDGHLYWEDSILTPVTDETGKIEGIVAIKTEITEKKRAERELRLARDQADAANNAKSNFLAMVSHELRTPLNAIIGFSELISTGAMGAITPRIYMDYAVDILSSGRLLLSLVNEIIDLTKVETGKTELTLMPLDVSTVVQGVENLLRAAAGAREHEITVDLGPDLVAMVDARSVKQIAINLVSNSAKYSEARGRISVRTFRAKTGEVIMEVTDQGIGMSENEIALALEPFSRLPNTYTQTTPGMGLGLHVVRKLTEAMGANLEITSQIGVGTRIAVRFKTLPDRIG